MASEKETNGTTDLAVAQKPPPNLSITKGGIAIRDLDELWRLANIMVKGGIAPKGMGAEAACGVMAFGIELGLSPIQSLKDIAFINGKPNAYGDALSGLINRSGLLDGAPEVEYEGAGDNLTCIVALKRKGMSGAFVGEYSMAMAKRAGLASKDTWRNYPERMLYWRAYTYAARDGFSDVLKGLTLRDEAEEIAAGEARIIDPDGEQRAAPIRRTRRLPAPQQPPRQKASPPKDEIPDREPDVMPGDGVTKAPPIPAPKTQTRSATAVDPRDDPFANPPASHREPGQD